MTYRSAARGGPSHGTGELRTKFCADRYSGSRDMLADRQTDRHTDRPTGWSQYTAPLLGRSNEATSQSVAYRLYNVMQLRTPGTTVVIVIMWKPGQLHLTSFAEWFLSYQTDGRIPLKIPDFALLNDTVVFWKYQPGLFGNTVTGRHHGGIGVHACFYTSESEFVCEACVKSVA